MAKYLDQAGLQLVLSKITNKYDGRYLGIHATADAAEKVVHKLTINVRDEESRVFDGSQDFSIDVAQAEHIHPATEVTYSNAAVTGAANVNEALDIIVKNIQIGAAAISNATSNMNAVKEALDQEVADRTAADAAIQAELDALESFVEERLDGDGNIFDILEAAKAELKEMVDAEADRAMGIEAGLREDVDDHEERLLVIEGGEEVEGSIKKAVKDEKDRAMAAEGNLNTAIQTEKGRAEAAEQKLTDDLADEVEARLQAEEGLSQRITTNKNAIDVLNGDENTEGSVAKDIKDAEARVKVVTDALDGRMTGAEGRLDVIQGTGEGSIKKAIADLVNGAPETLDTLQEIAKALRDNPDVLSAIEQAFDLKLTTLEDKHDKEKKELDDAIAKEVEDRAAAVLAEENARKQADKDLSDRIAEIEDLVGDESMSLKDIREAIEANALAIKTEKERAEGVEAGIQAQLDKVDGAADVDGSFRKAIADQAATQLAKDNAQDQRVQALEDKVGNDGGSADESTGLVATLRGAIEAEASSREQADAEHDRRLAAVEELIGDAEGSTTLKDLNERLTEAEKDIDQCQADIIQNAKDIAAIVALEETDIDAAFAAVFQ